MKTIIERAEEWLQVLGNPDPNVVAQFGAYEPLISKGSQAYNLIHDLLTAYQDLKGKVVELQSGANIIPTGENGERGDLCRATKSGNEFYGSYHECLGWTNGSGTIEIIQRAGRPVIYKGE